MHLRKDNEIRTVQHNKEVHFQAR